MSRTRARLIIGTIVGVAALIAGVLVVFNTDYAGSGGTVAAIGATILVASMEGLHSGGPKLRV